MSEKPKATEAKPSKPPKHRSPNFPSINLSVSIDKTATLYQHFKRHPMPLAKVLEKLDYKADSSSGQQVAAALKAFGLVDVNGTGKSRTIAVSENGEKIVRNHAQRPDLIKVAALSPKVHREMWVKFFSEAEPSPPAVVRQYMLWDRPEGKFSELSADAFLKEFAETISFAKVGSSDKIPDESRDDDDAEGSDLSEHDDNSIKKKLAAGVREFSFPLIGGVAVLRVPHPMGLANFTMLQAVLVAAKDALTTESPSPPPTSEK